MAAPCGVGWDNFVGAGWDDVKCSLLFYVRLRNRILLTHVTIVTQTKIYESYLDMRLLDIFSGL